MAQLNALGSILFAVQAEANGLPARQNNEALDDYIDRVAVDEIMKHDFEMAVESANSGNTAGLQGCMHSIRVYFEPRDAPIKRRAKDLTPGT